MATWKRATSRRPSDETTRRHPHATLTSFAPPPLSSSHTSPHRRLFLPHALRSSVLLCDLRAPHLFQSPLLFSTLLQTHLPARLCLFCVRLFAAPVSIATFCHSCLFFFFSSPPDLSLFSSSSPLPLPFLLAAVTRSFRPLSLSLSTCPRLCPPLHFGSARLCPPLPSASRRCASVPLTGPFAPPPIATPSSVFFFSLHFVAAREIPLRRLSSALLSSFQRACEERAAIKRGERRRRAESARAVEFFSSRRCSVPRSPFFSVPSFSSQRVFFLSSQAPKLSFHRSRMDHPTPLAGFSPPARFFPCSPATTLATHAHRSLVATPIFLLAPPVLCLPVPSCPFLFRPCPVRSCLLPLPFRSHHSTLFAAPLSISSLTVSRGPTRRPGDLLRRPSPASEPQCPGAFPFFFSPAPSLFFGHATRACHQHFLETRVSAPGRRRERRGQAELAKNRETDGAPLPEAG